jgi:lysophospholipase
MELIDTPFNPCPPGGNVVGLRAADGVRLRAAIWRPRGTPRGTIALIQGRAEFIEKYYEVIGELLARGFVVAAFDWRGQGLSQRLLRHGHKGHLRRATDYRLDLAAFQQHVLLPDCPRPWFALAHSMGGTALLDFAGAGPDAAPYERIVTIAPLIDLYGWAGSAAAHRLASVLHACGLGRVSMMPGARRTLADLPFANNVLTRDPRRFSRAVEMLRAAPALALAAPTVGWVHAAFQLGDRLKSDGFAENIRTPVLFLAGGNERLVSNPAIETFARRLKNAACVVVADCEHELLMERDEIRAQFWAAFDAFIPGEPFLHKANAKRTQEQSAGAESASPASSSAAL